MLCKRFDKMINFLRNPHRPLKRAYMALIFVYKGFLTILDLSRYQILVFRY